MILALSGSLLAQGHTFDDQAWVIIAIAIVSAIGGLLKKRKAEQGKKEAPQPGRPTPTGADTTRPPAPQRRPAPLPPTRPGRQPSAPPTQRAPVARRAPELARRAEEPELPRGRAAKVQARPIEPARQPPAPELPLQAVRPEFAKPAAAAAARGEQRAAAARVRLEQLLADRTGAQAGVLAAEILGPPLALREDRL